MTWHRGFAVCPDSELTAVRALLETQANVSPLTTHKGETALAFTSRGIPDLGQHRVFVIGVGHEEAIYGHVSFGGFSPKHLVPRLGLTFGLVVARDCSTMRSKVLRRHIKQLGETSDEGEEDGVLGLRWDLECGVDDPKIQLFANSLAEIESALAQAGEPYRIATFNGQVGTVRGELEEAAGVFGDPLAIVVIEWPGQDGGINQVAANDSEIVVNGDDIPDLDLLSE